MNSFDDLLKAYARQVGLPWQEDVPPAGRVWLLWFDKSMQRRIAGRLEEFEHATIKAGHGWRRVDISLWFGRWIAQHEFFEPLVQNPQELRGLLPDARKALIHSLRAELDECAADDILAVDGCGALFGVASVSSVISEIADSIPGRLLVTFPGKHTAGVYRLLDARDGWNYHAVPIPPDSAY